MTVMLCSKHHRGPEGVHGGNTDLYKRLLEEAKMRFIQAYGEDVFQDLFAEAHKKALEKLERRMRRDAS